MLSFLLKHMEIECIVAYSHVDVFLAKDSILCSTL